MSSDGSAVLFRAFPGKKFSAEEKRQLKNFTRTLSQTVAGGCRFTCLVTTDQELRQLNSQFLQHDYATDVLSFPSAADAGELGDIAISIERAESQAQEFGHNCMEEICVLMLHGVLHLLGMDHETDEGEMARAEQQWRSKLGLPATLISRANRLRSA